MSQATGSLRKTWFYVISILFVLANAMLVWNEQYWFMLVPAALWFVFFVTFSMVRDSDEGRKFEGSS
jgi:hypothetical protein